MPEEGLLIGLALLANGEDEWRVVLVREGRAGFDGSGSRVTLSSETKSEANAERSTTEGGLLDEGSGRGEVLGLS